MAGFLFTVMVVMIACAQFPSGVISDRIGERTILILSVLGSTFGVIVLASAPSFPFFFGGCVLFGLGAGLYSPPTISVLSKIFPERSGTAHGVIFASGSIGTTVLPVIAGFAAVTVGWRIGFASMIPIFAVITVGVWKLVPASKTTTDDSAGASSITEIATSGFFGVLRQDILFVAVPMILVVVVFHAISAFLPTYLIEIKGMSQQRATTVFGLFFAGSFVFQVFAGMLADRWPIRGILLAITALSVVSIIGLTLASWIVSIMGWVVLLSVISAYISVANTYFVSTLPDRIQGSGIGILRTIIIGIGGSSPLFIGYLVDAGRFSWAFQLLAGSLVVAAVILAISLVVSRV